MNNGAWEALGKVKEKTKWEKEQSETNGKVRKKANEKIGEVREKNSEKAWIGMTRIGMVREKKR